MDLSIIIINFNTSELLQQCLKSIIDSIEDDNILYEIIIVDNNSKDNSVYDLNKFIKENKQGNIHLIENSTNTGFSKANNQALSISRGRYVLLLNPDTIIIGNVFRPLIDFMESNPETGALTCRLVLKNGRIDQACHRGFPTLWNSFTYFSGLEKIFPKSKSFSGYSMTYKKMDEIHEIDSGCGAFLLVRKTAGEKINWLDEDYFWYGEDIDFCYRLKQDNWKIFFIPDIEVIHLKGASSGLKKHSRQHSKINRKEKYAAVKSSTEVMRIFFKKHYKQKYPNTIFKLALFFIGILEKIRLLKFKLSG